MSPHSNHGGHILVVDDEVHIQEVIQYALSSAGFSTSVASSAEQATSFCEKTAYDAIVLDVVLPGYDGLHFCRTLRQDNDVPILFLSSRGEEVDRILGLELGGDDYLVKPFSPRELVTRVRSLVRRYRRQFVGVTRNPRKLIRFGPMVVDEDAYEVRIHDHKVDLTATEFRLLATIVSAPERVHSRATLIDSSYEPDHHITGRTVDSHIRRIRAKLRVFSVDIIETVHGVGYRARFSSTMER